MNFQLSGEFPLSDGDRCKRLRIAFVIAVTAQNHCALPSFDGTAEAVPSFHLHIGAVFTRWRVAGRATWAGHAISTRTFVLAGIAAGT